jgi:hypothetical protein
MSGQFRSHKCQEPVMVQTETVAEAGRALLGTCSQMLQIKNKATRKMLSIKVLRPS